MGLGQLGTASSASLAHCRQDNSTQPARCGGHLLRQLEEEPAEWAGEQTSGWAERRSAVGAEPGRWAEWCRGLGASHYHTHTHTPAAVLNSGAIQGWDCLVAVVFGPFGAGGGWGRRQEVVAGHPPTHPLLGGPDLVQWQQVVPFCRFSPDRKLKNSFFEN